MTAITIIGNVTRDPEFRGGGNVAMFSVASNDREKDRDTGEYVDKPSFFDVVCFGEMADHVADSVTRGMRLVVTGRMRQRSYETKEGEKRTVWEVLADEVAPSLRWATAEVTKASGGSNGQSRPRQTASAAAQRSVTDSSGRSVSGDYDERPF